MKIWNTIFTTFSIAIFSWIWRSCYTLPYLPCAGCECACLAAVSDDKRAKGRRGWRRKFYERSSARGRRDFGNRLFPRSEGARVGTIPFWQWMDFICLVTLGEARFTLCRGNPRVGCLDCNRSPDSIPL